MIWFGWNDTDLNAHPPVLDQNKGSPDFHTRLLFTQTAGQFLTDTNTNRTKGTDFDGLIHLSHMAPNLINKPVGQEVAVTFLNMSEFAGEPAIWPCIHTYAHGLKVSSQDCTIPLPGLDLTQDEELISQTSETFFWKVFPNPTENQLFLNLPGSEKSTALVQMFDLKGNKIKLNVEQKNNSVQPIEMGSLPSGLYFVHVSKGNQVKNFKIRKN